MKYRVKVRREYWGYIDVEANSRDEAIEKVENYECEGEFVAEIRSQSVYSTKLLKSEDEHDG